MKAILFLVLFLSCAGNLFAEDFGDGNFSNNTFEKASIPDFLPLVGKALPGRCLMASSSNKKTASVLMVSFEEEGFEVAPFDAEKKREDIFDKMTYEDVLKEFPLIKKMFLEVKETAEGGRIDKDINLGAYRGELRESNRYIIMRVFINDKLYKFCNYSKIID
jgi:hypothetical protein